MSDYGDEIIIKKVVSENPDAPVMRAEITIGGQKYKAGLWFWRRKDGSLVLDKAENKQYKGKIEVDDYQAAPKQARRESAGRDNDQLTPPADDFKDDDIPF